MTLLCFISISIVSNSKIVVGEVEAMVQADTYTWDQSSALNNHKQKICPNVGDKVMLGLYREFNGKQLDFSELESYFLLHQPKEDKVPYLMNELSL